MKLRDRINERPTLALGFGGGLIVVATVGALLVNRGGRGTNDVSAKAYFSDDDGKTFFADDRTKLPPFDHGGKQAVRAIVYEAAGTRFVNHLERYTPDGLRFAQASAAATGGTARPKPPSGATLEVKRPGESAWTPTNDMSKAALVMSVKPPTGASGSPIQVDP